MIDFVIDNNRILLRYTPELRQNWVKKAFEERREIIFKKTFTFTAKDLIELENTTEDFEGYMQEFDEFEPSHFLFGEKEGDYFKIKRNILTDLFDIYIFEDVKLTTKYFVADSNVSIFGLISKISTEDFYLGGEKEHSISVDVFENMVRYFPTSYERQKYVEARVSSVLKNYMDDVKDAETIFQQYLNKKLPANKNNLLSTFKESELLKYETILEKLQTMLSSENQYSEHQWQEEILQIILLLYPKYIFVFKSVPIIGKLGEVLNERQLDFLLVDSNGNVDIIEIKKPFGNVIMTKGTYRNNFIPLRDLSGTVMQIEKYIYYLNRWSYAGEVSLTARYQAQLPVGFNIKITNPIGLIIMGRENNLSVEQKRDFEVVKRKYKNVVDIITYDNLLERLSFMIEQIKKH